MSDEQRKDRQRKKDKRKRKKKPPEPGEELMTKIVSLCKRRGFVFQSSEIYGGLQSSYDYGPLGVELKRNIKEEWWRSMVHSREDVVGLDAAIIMHPKVWEASGHVAGFSDPLVDCKECKNRFREDHLVPGEDGKVVCPECGGELTEPRQFNLMFKTHMGPVEDDASVAYLRPETAQSMFVDFQTVQAAGRLKLPFGIAQIGKSFRNEIVVEHFIYRSREFEQMEMEYFVEPGADEKWYEYWRGERLEWYARLGVRRENLRLRDHEESERAHYAKACTDVEYLYPWGWGELEGVANRTDYDLSHHAEASGKRITYFDPQSNKHIVPYVIEPAAGVDRSALMFLIDAYHEEPPPEGRKEGRVVLKLHPRLAPIKAAVLPLVRKDGMPERGREIVKEFWRHSVNAFYDEKNSVGRRYRRQDEAGTPYCITVDGQTKDDDTVTIRERDTMKQDRIKVEEAVKVVRDRLAATLD
jgi:glycyl-tRNA synthetase